MLVASYVDFLAFFLGNNLCLYGKIFDERFSKGRLFSVMKQKYPVNRNRIPLFSFNVANIDDVSRGNNILFFRNGNYCEHKDIFYQLDYRIAMVCIRPDLVRIAQRIPNEVHTDKMELPP